MKIVLMQLKQDSTCKDKDYCIGCYGCGVRLVYKTLKSHFDFTFNSVPAKKK